jgi:hypothetical protein
MRLLLAGVIVGYTLTAAIAQPARPVHATPDSVKFAVIGDSGTGRQPQYEVAERMASVRTAFPFDVVLMLGDNFYGGQGPEDLKQKFDRPYARLLEAGVVFRAALGNHDDPETRFYPPLNMHGQRYYTFADRHVRFFVLDTTAVDDAQLRWLDAAMESSREAWKVCYFHHPLYSSAARHGSSIDLRVLLEPILIRHGVRVVWSGHDHAYERIRPQRGIYYFVAGSAGQLRSGDIRPSALTAASFDRDQSFMLVEISESELRFRTISRAGDTVDAGVIAPPKRGDPAIVTPGNAGAHVGAGMPIDTERGVK